MRHEASRSHQTHLAAYELAMDDAARQFSFFLQYALEALPIRPGATIPPHLRSDPDFISLQQARARLPADTDWLHFLEACAAGSAAIAMYTLAPHLPRHRTVAGYTPPPFLLRAARAGAAFAEAAPSDSHSEPPSEEDDDADADDGAYDDQLDADDLLGDE
jgi:hypothetical protein